ncbi:CNNM domain-containing protein [Dechloromonas sp. XY25]|uniref:CNNM domain-containing protein n=1 Tax=Dechloromonas hankyongensis TaxID=2908002 RepID=A0ABS9K5S9_9RHOO|nr:CNNM domain-containing protein [Dechloromonas hankyongensis]MCG2578435.1 CNNM domain-containing protein [Dechloromonas hankyongensis]
MTDIPLAALLGALVVLLIFSGIFSGAETAMMAANPYRLRHAAQNGHRGAKLALALLGKTDKLLGLILLGNTLLNAAAATLTGYIALALFGESKWALEIGTLCITFALLVVAEISPKVICATYADRLAPLLSYILTPLLRLAYPIIWFVNLFVTALLKSIRLAPSGLHEETKLSPEELRSLVLESAHLMPKKHHTILSSLFELNNITVEDLMTPRGSIEILDLDLPWEEVRNQLATSHHSRLPACRESLDQLIGILPVRRLLASIGDSAFDEASLLQQVQPPYYIPAGTPVFSQLAFFQENRQRIGFVVDEYGEILGLLTLEDIIEEFVGDFTTSIPGLGQELRWSDEGDTIVEGSRPLRDINRMLGLDFPLDGPKTLNGLILEHFQDIPESGISIKLAGIAVEILQTQDRSVVTVRIFRPEAA